MKTDFVPSAAASSERFVFCFEILVERRLRAGRVRNKIMTYHKNLNNLRSIQGIKKVKGCITSLHQISSGTYHPLIEV